MAYFEGYDRRIAQIEKCLKEYGFASLDEMKEYTLKAGVNAEEIVRSVQPIAFENAVWAYTLGCAIALKKGCTKAADAAEAIGIGLQAFCIPGSVADQRSVGLGHGNLAAMLLREETKCFAFLAGHESFAAAEGAIGIAKTANKVRKQPLQVILNGLGKTGTTFAYSMISLFVRLLFVFFAIPRFGINGYLYGLLASQLVQTLLCMYAVRSYR